MELRDIEYFAAIAEHGHLGRAAETLRLTQPALSKSLRRLEQAVGAKLVKRTPRGVELTAEGIALQSHVRELRLSLAGVARKITDLRTGRAGHVRLGAAPGMVEGLLLQACTTFVQEAPDATLTVIVAAIDALRPALRNGELDLILSGLPTPPVEGAVHELLLKDEVVVFASAQHRLAKRARVTITDIARERWVMTVVNEHEPSLPQQALEENGIFGPRIAMKTSYLPLRDQVVASSDLLGVSSRRVLRHIADQFDLVELKVPEFTRTRHVAVTYRKDAYLSPAAQRLIKLLKGTAASMDSCEPTTGERRKKRNLAPK